jgi:hypothetical protein
MRNWTPEARAKQAALCRRHRPWAKSTGPRSAAGKAASSRNARKTSFTRRDLQRIRAVLRLQKRQLKAIMADLPPMPEPEAPPPPPSPSNRPNELI